MQPDGINIFSRGAGSSARTWSWSTRSYIGGVRIVDRDIADERHREVFSLRRLDWYVATSIDKKTESGNSSEREEKKF